MHNLKEIRKNFDSFKESLNKRNVDIDFELLKKLDEENRDLIQNKEALENEKKSISKSKDENLFKKSKEISKKLDEITEKQKIIKKELDTILSNIPNVPHEDVPNGKNENDNVEISKSGKIPEFDLPLKSEFSGCKSWIELNSNFQEGESALKDNEIEGKLKEFKEIVE